MLIQINGIGKQKIKYKNHSELEFDTLANYVKMAKKAISKFANKVYSGLSSKMLKDEDAISSIANAMMMADWRWDKDYTSKDNQNNGKKTKYSYRNQCAIWAIKSYVSKNQQSKFSKKIYSLNHDMDVNDPSDYYHNIEDKQSISPEDIVCNNEDKEKLSNLINSLLSLDCLSNRQRDYIKLYYFENYTFDKIGKKYGITREAVRQGLGKAIQLIKDQV